MATEEGDGKFISKLDEASKRKAKEELNERNEEDRRIAVQTLRQWVITQQDWLTCPTDFSFLLKFLRVRKYSQLGARQTLENYWTSKTTSPEWFHNLDPGEEKVLALFKTGFLLSPKKRDKDGRRVVIERPGKVDIDLLKKEWGIDTFFRCLFIFSDWLTSDENVQVNGIKVLFDMSDVTRAFAMNIYTPDKMKRMVPYFMKSQPARVKGLNMYNEPLFFDSIFAMIRPFLREKILQRFHLHGKSMVNVYKTIDMSVLPDEYLPDDYEGNKIGSCDFNLNEMLDDMMKPEFRSYIRDLSSGKYGVDLAKKTSLDSEPAASFRKLNVD